MQANCSRVMHGSASVHGQSSLWSSLLVLRETGSGKALSQSVSARETCEVCCRVVSLDNTTDTRI
jgi:hypothetical protein